MNMSNNSVINNDQHDEISNQMAYLKSNIKIYGDK